MAPVTSLLTFGLLALPAAFAHPGHDLAEEAAERAAFMKRSPNTVRSCASQLERRGFSKAALARRQAIAQKARVKRGLNSPLVRRDFAAYNVSHESTSGVSYGDDETLLFQDDSTCILQPEVTQGPYYVDGELIRSDITDGQEGIPSTLTSSSSTLVLASPFRLSTWTSGTATLRVSTRASRHLAMATRTI